jgi:hypothetical protein
MSYTRKLRIGTDGSVAYGINSVSAFSMDATGGLILSDTNISDSARLGGNTDGFPLTTSVLDMTNIFFNQNTRITKFEIVHNHTASMQLQIFISTDTTNGIDGTWTTPIMFGGNAYTPAIAANTLVSLDNTDVATCKGIRVQFYGATTPYGAIRLFNIYGEHLNPLFRFFKADGTTEVDDASQIVFTKTFSKYALNSEVVNFKLKNIDSVPHTFNVKLTNVGSSEITTYMGVIDSASLTSRAGTISIANGAVAVIGTATDFTAADVGKVIKVGSQVFNIVSYTDATNVTVGTAATSLVTSTAYTISVKPTSVITTASVAATTGVADLILVLNIPANAPVAVGSSQYSIDVTAN